MYIHKNERILIADDEEYISEILSSMLASAGYNCTTSTDGHDALAKLSKDNYALLLLDYKMPGISGEEVLLEVIKNYPETAVIMVTSTADVNTVIRMMKIGAYDYLIKPVDQDLLHISVNRALERRKLILENRNYQAHLEEKVREQTEKIRGNLLSSITSLAFALEAKDIYTSGHSQRVAGIGVIIAKVLELEADMRERIKIAGLVHDIGKIGIREEILNKNDDLTDEEFFHISSHSILGERIIKPVIEDETIALIVRHHHERYDGKGYPDGLKGEEIPLGARILAVADTYDAMTSNRPYRQALSHQIALTELEIKAGSQFDPDIVRAFMSTKDTDLSWIDNGKLVFGNLSQEKYL